jgi:hypothetical protein
MARANIEKSMSAPAAIDGNSWLNSVRYVGLAFRCPKYGLANRLVAKTGPVRPRHNLTLGIVKDVESRTDCLSRASESSYLHQLGGRKMSLCDQQVGHYRIVCHRSSVSFGRREVEF